MGDIFYYYCSYRKRRSQGNRGTEYDKIETGSDGGITQSREATQDEETALGGGQAGEENMLINWNFDVSFVVQNN